MGHHNPKSGQGDGAGFGRLRAAQAMRHNFTVLLNSRNPSADGLYIDQIREYAGVQVVFYRYDVGNVQFACVATFHQKGRGHVLINDVVINEVETNND